MGKRPSRAGVSGLSNFLHVFNEPAPSETGAAVASSSAVAPVASSSSATTLKRSAPSESEGPNAKKRKATFVNSAPLRYDASSLVPRYVDASQVPAHLQKYFAQRHRYFSRYDEGCLLDETGWFSVTPERVADQIAERCRCDTILDAFCGVGGNAIAFAKTCQRVIALDTSPTRLALARHNAEVYGVADHIEFILCDYISFARSYLSRPRKDRTIDAVFLSPPWGGPGYLSAVTEEALPAADETHPEYSLASVQPLHGAELFALTRQITPNVAYFLPRNTRLQEVSELLKSHPASATEHVEVEEEWMGNKLKALTCYFGGLVAGQEDLFEQRPST